MDLSNVFLCTSAEIEYNAAEPCLIDFRYYEFTNCCTLEVLSFSPGKTVFVSIAPGTYLYTGANYQGLETGTCYTVANATTQDPTFFGNLPDVPANSTANYTAAAGCNDTSVCPGCWYVEEIQDIPSDVPITVDVAYIGSKIPAQSVKTKHSGGQFHSPVVRLFSHGPLLVITGIVPETGPWITGYTCEHICSCGRFSGVLSISPVSQLR